MKKKLMKQILATCLSLLLVLSNFSGVANAETFSPENQDWTFAAFGSNTGISGDTIKNPPPTYNEDGSITIEARGGKIESKGEGISYLYKEFPADQNFTIKTKMYLNDYIPGNQEAFGLMVRDGVGEHGKTSSRHDHFVASGVLKDVATGFYNFTGNGVVSLEKFGGDNLTPGTDGTYDISIRKSGNIFVLSSNGEREVIEMNEGVFTDTIAVGLFVARDAIITFSNTAIETPDKNVTSLAVNTDNMKKDYLVGEHLNLDGLEVTATFEDGSEQALTSDEYIVTGFDSSQEGTNTIKINYNGAAATIDLNIVPLTLTKMDIVYYPAITEYYPLDTFDAKGLVIEGTYNSGATELLNSDQYIFSIDGNDVVEGVYQFDNTGNQTITVASVQHPEVTTTFDVHVKDAALEQLEVVKEPSKTVYFTDDAELDLDGLVVKATYSDGVSFRLLKNQYSVSAFDPSKTGVQEIRITHKGLETSFDITVKNKELTGLEISNYPKTTFNLGSEFSSEGLEVSEVYDNGDKVVLGSEDYQVQSAAFQSGTPGTYTISIVPLNTSIQPISYDVSVRETPQVEWKFTQFGQSTSEERNRMEVLENGAIRLISDLPQAGKITGDHDGISYYYTEIDGNLENFTLSADIKVNSYAKTPYDGQESFGIMARDANGTYDDSSVFASNIAAVGGFSGGTREANGLQLFVRKGVTSPDGAGSEGIQKQMLQEGEPADGSTHRLTLTKTNSGFIGQLGQGEEKIFFEPEILTVQDDKIYVGFYTARLADIEVSNITFDTSIAATDAPRIEPPAQQIQPNFSILSRGKTSDTAYNLIVESNVNGTLTVKKGQQVIERDVVVESGEKVTIPTTIDKNSQTKYSFIFVPDDTQLLTSYDRIIKNFTVTNKTFNEGGDIIVSTEGTESGNGTEASPLDLDTAIEYVLPGQKIILQEGTYKRTAGLYIDKYNDGKKDAMKYLVGAEGTRPIIDFDKRSEGVVLSGNYWHVKGIDFARSASNTKGFVVGGSHNIIELSRFYENGDTGLQISRTDNSPNMEDWPSYNLSLNNDSFSNSDPSQNNADGFAAKLTSGVGNVFKGNVAYNNADDGWDLYTKVGSGKIGAVTIEDSIAYANGISADGVVGIGDGNGFKLGGEGVHVPHVIKNSLAFGNKTDGFTSNSNPGVIAENNRSFNNGGANIVFTTYNNIEEDFTINGFISYKTSKGQKDSYPVDAVAENNYFFSGTESVNAIGTVLTDANFKSLTPVLPIERDEEGNIIWGDFVQFQVIAQVTVNPEKINLAGKSSSDVAGAVEVLITLQDGFSIEDIGLESIRLNGKAQPITSGTGYAKNPVLEDENVYRIKFTKKELTRVLNKGKDVPITITGNLADGTPFVGKTTVEVK
ncbi:bacterial Ig-like domain-containing protein [Litchfieldia alkalitelluris]|uniref:bacterial Ig-like domain-containing protein n=1 Tax=Litchfieldia alkalitelluris TaxID=304268 RepID=UPI001F1B99DE|nr:bacterial Ig-like domain-containing protein [Litchfieldia alkalitelluris]